jgi:aspartate/glutamate racemase
MVWSFKRWIARLFWRPPRRLKARRRFRSHWAPGIQTLEIRVLLSGVDPVQHATPMLVPYRTGDGAAPFSTPSPTGYTPTQIRHAYGFDTIAFNSGTVVGDGSNTTIAIVDAFDDPNIANDLHKFDVQFGLPDPIFTKVDQNGGTAYPAPNAGWITEIALDVEWAHAIAPNAAILLVEANTNSFANLLTAVDYARHATGVVAVSMSWGAGDFSSETAFDSYFTSPANHGGVTFVASSGDNGAPPEFPAVSANVVSIGGTTLQLDSAGNWISETGWSGSGGGVSAYVPQPAYQNGIVTQTTTMRANPDVAYDSDPYTGFPVYDSYNNGITNPWGQWGGTSDAAPQWAALIAIADQGRALVGRGSLDGATETLPALYALASGDYHDIISGTSTGAPNYSAGPGYDLVTGRGSPFAAAVVNDLVGPTSTVPDIRVVSATADGRTTFSLSYAIDNVPVTQFDVGIYRSDDTAFGGDTLLSTVTISAAADLSVGMHTKTWTIGSGAGQIALPGAGASDISQDYYLLAVADPTDAIVETDTTSPGLNNVAVFTGVYHAPGGGVFVQGTSGADSVAVSGALNVTVNGHVYSYTPSDVAAVVVRSHAADDSIDASAASISLTAFGGAGNDTLKGGSGADFLICPDNTIHQAFDLVEQRSPRPWLHIAQEVASEARRSQFKRIGVLGTRYLMEGPVYPEKLKAVGLEHRIPGPQARERINQIIMDELVNAQFTPRSLEYFQEVIRTLGDQGCDAVVLGCTEIPLLVTPDSSSLPTLDSTRLLARAAVKIAVGVT